MDSNKNKLAEKTGWKCFAKAVLFAVLLVALVLLTSRVMSIDTSDYETTMIRGVYEELPGTLDGIYIGSSNSYAYWNSMVAFREYGITVMPLASSAQPFAATESLIRQAREAQPDAVYIVNLNSTHRWTYSDSAMHFLLDYMPLSWEKLRLTALLCEQEGLSWIDSLEYYLPLIRYHSRWDQLTPGSFVNMHKDYKNSFAEEKYVRGITDISASFSDSRKIGEVKDNVLQSLYSLLDYCDEENVKILFVVVPQAKAEERVETYNKVSQLITARGYPVVNLLAGIDETNIHTATDFYNADHTNIHGSLKFTHYMSHYLLEHYGLADKRQDSRYDSWREALDRYTPVMTRYALDFEIQGGDRDYSLAQPENLTAVAENGAVRLSWEEVPGAAGFTVYRKSQASWKQLAWVEGETFTDTEAEEGIDYTYTVVPCRISGGRILYGNFLYNGVKVVNGV